MGRTRRKREQANAVHAKAGRESLFCFVVWLVFAAGVTTTLVVEECRERSFARWARADAMVRSAEVVRTGDRPHLALDLEVAGPAGPRPVITADDDPGRVTGRYADLARLRDTTYKPPAVVPVFVNPDRPDEVVLRRRGPLDYAWLLLPAFFILVGVWGVRTSWLAWRHGRDPELPRRGGALMVIVIVVAMLTGGALIAHKMWVDTLGGYLASRGWQPAWCRVVDAWSTRSGRRLKLRVVFEYERHGRVYRSDRVSWLNDDDAGRPSPHNVSRFAIGSERVCYVDRDDPYEAVLDRSLGWAGPLLLFPLPFLAIGIGGAWMIVGRVRRGEPIAGDRNRRGRARR